MAHTSVSTEGQPRPLSPPLTATIESRSVVSTPTNTLGMPSPLSVKRKEFHEAILLSQPPAPTGKRLKTVRSRSHPPPKNNRMARSRDGRMPDLDEDGMPIRLTPTTGRISKAKKGLPVHHCQYGCGKVYTRAEHRKRHEQNHRKDALFRCTFPDCQKDFQRFDLFQRHLETRHGQGLAVNSVRASSVDSAITSSTVQDIADPLSLQGISQGTAMGGLSTPPYAPPYPAYTMDQTHSQMGWHGSQHLQGAVPASASNQLSGMYSSSLHHSSSQMMAQLQSDRSRDMSVPPTEAQGGFGNDTMQVSNASASSVWPQTSAWPQHAPVTGTTGAFHEAYGAVDEPRGRKYSIGLEHVASTAADAGDSISAVLGAPDQIELPGLDAELLRHYDECYWAEFDPLFPIVHRPSYSPASLESQLMGTMIVAIGCHFSRAPSSAVHSRKAYELADGLINQVNLTPDLLQVPITTLQGIFLWEYYSLFKSRTPGVHRSQLFVMLYNQLLESGGCIARDGEGRRSEYESWSHLEISKRLLAACFVLDTYRSTFFHQTATRVLPPDVDLPRPCPDQLWAAVDEGAWRALASGRSPTPSTTPFKTALEYSLGLHLQGRVNFEHSAGASFVGWALQLAAQAPVRSLLLLANENAQVFRIQASPDEWTVAKRRVQQWLEGPNASSDVACAGKVLNSFFSNGPLFQASGRAFSDGLGFEVEWCLFIAAVTFWTFSSLSLGGGAPVLFSGQFPQQHQGVATTSSSRQQSVITTGLPSPSFTASPRSVASTMSPISPFLASQPLQLPTQRTQSFGSLVERPTDLSLQHTLHMLDTADPATLSQLRGSGGSMPVMCVVRNILLRDLHYKSSAIMEAVDVLNTLIENEEMSGLLTGL